MRVQLDVQLRHRLRFNFSNWIQATTVEFQGWKGTKNGILLSLTAQRFDAFITMDRGIEFQQNRRTNQLILIPVPTKTNRYADVYPLLLFIEAALAAARPGQLLRVTA